MIKYIFTLTTVLILSFFSASSQVMVSNGGSNNFKYTDYIYGVCHYLDIKNKYIIIRKTDLQVQAYSCRVNDSIYVILINRHTCIDIASSLTHELIHISDDIHNVYEINKPTLNLYTNRYTSSEARKIEASVRKRTDKIKHDHKYLIYKNYRR